jgi:cysteine desulfurase
MYYLDYLASTPVLPKVLSDMQTAFENAYANPSSTHECGQESAGIIDDCRQLIADKIGALPSEIIFTSGATEANNFAIKGLAFANQHKGKHIITSAIEHKCVLNICAYLQTQGFEISYVMPTADGIITAKSVQQALRADTILVSIMHVNNELATINPIEEIGEVCYQKEILFHSDAAQSFGKLDIDIVDMNLEAISVSAHKFGGPKGIGFAYMRDARNSTIEPVIHGSGHQHGLRGGTLPTPLIVGLSSAAENYIYDKEKLLGIKQRFFDQLDEKSIDYTINGNECLANAFSIEFHDEAIVNSLMVNKEICISQGSACNSKEIKPSHVLKAIGLTDEQTRSTFRISFWDEKILKLIQILSPD